MAEYRNKDYDIFAIQMSGHPVSQMYLSKILPSWERNNYKVDLFEAIVPDDLPSMDDLAFSFLKTYNKKEKRWEFRRDFTETEKAVWYSHFLLWEKVFVSERPAVIIEHDSRLIRHLPSDLSKVKFLSYCNDTWSKNRTPSGRDPGDGNGKFLCPGSGYYITPDTARNMVKSALNTEIDMQVDGFLRNFIPVTQNSDVYFIEQIIIDNLNTIDHRKNYRSFVPL